MKSVQSASDTLLDDRRLSHAATLDLFQRVKAAFSAHRDEIDALNVFPVPDGDTGSNLLHTVRFALDHAADAADAASDGSDALARGALLGARGNSGVIFSQVVRAVVEAEGDSFDEWLVEVLRRSDKLSSTAVATPADGTILTVIAAAAASAERLAGTVDELTGALCAEVTDAVARTREQNEVSRRAGVVDAGARGFEVFLRTLHGMVTGAAPPKSAPTAVVPRQTSVGQRESGSLEFKFEVQYLLATAQRNEQALRDRLELVGDSVVVVSMGDLLNVHVHTNDVGLAIEEGLLLGQPSQISVTYFPDQIPGEIPGDPAASTPSATRLAAVAVLPGPRLGDLATQPGVTVVDGSAGSLPSVGDLVAAVQRTGAARVVVLPGHPNVVPTARQLPGLVAEQSVAIADGADSVPAVLAALALWDGAADFETLFSSLQAAAYECAGAEVVTAVRDADTPIGPVCKGQFLSVSEDKVFAVADDPLVALTAALDRCMTAQAEVITLIAGADVDDAERAEAIELVERVAGDTREVVAIDGQQTPVRYFVGVE